jgi:ubiquitin-protein ligase
MCLKCSQSWWQVVKVSSASALRRNQDQQRLLQLIGRAGGALQSKGVLDTQRDRLSFELHLPTVANNNYPTQIQQKCAFEIQLPVRYPFAPPTAKMLSPLWHPNVFSNGNICLGTRWQATEGLDLFVTRIVKLLIYDPLLVNLQSMAHAEAGRWYRLALAAHADAFPTVLTHADHWLRDPRGLNLTTERVEKMCTSCNATLRLPKGRSGIVQCPKCRFDFEVQT